MHQEDEQPVEIESDVTPTNWKNPPNITDLKSDLEATDQSHQTHVQNVSTWLDNLNTRGGAIPKTRKDRSKHVPKLIRKHAEWRYASLSEPFLSDRDLFKVSPKTWEDKKSAEQNALVLNNQFSTQIDRVAFIDELVRTAVDEGTVITKVQWDYDSEEYTEENSPVFEFQVTPDAEPLMQEISALFGENPADYIAQVPDELKESFTIFRETGQATMPIEVGVEDKVKTRVLRNQPEIEVCDYRNVRVDPACHGNLKKARYIIYSFDSTVGDLEKDSRYYDIDKVNVTNNSPLSEPDHSTDDLDEAQIKGRSRKKVVVYEYWGYWDVEGDGVLVPFVASWVGNTLVRMQENPYPDRELPFVKIQYLPVRKKVYGQPDGHLLEDNQKIAGAVTRGMLDTVSRSSSGQRGIRKDALDATNQLKFERGLDYKFNPQVDPRQGIYTHTIDQFPQAATYLLDQQTNDAEAMSGVKAFTDGVNGKSLGNVAAGINGVLDATTEREMGILRRISGGLIEIARKIVAMNGDFLDEMEIVRITNEEFIPVKRDDLAGNFDLHLSISTAEEDNTRAQELSFMLQTSAPGSDPAETRMIRAEIAKLRKMPELAKRIEDYQPEPDPIEQEARQLANEEKRAQIALLWAKAEKEGSASDLNEAKVGNLSSDTDLKNLDYVEQESGVTQERNLQHTSAQSEGNIKLEKVKAGIAQDAENRQHLTEYVKNLG